MATERVTTENDATISATDVYAACKRILASDMFKASPRMSRLLGYLVEKTIEDDVHGTNEYAIGIAVFDRQPSMYSTDHDPIVRVQIGRLRAKLRTYYATVGADAEIEISIPPGSYMPAIRRAGGARNESAKKKPALMIEPFKCVSPHEECEPFTLGLHDELVHRMHMGFAEIIVAPPLHFPAGADLKHPPYRADQAMTVSYWLEGSIQIDADRIRATIRLVDFATGRMAWSEQFDRKANFSIEHQEELAVSICDAVQIFLRQ